MFHRKDHSDQLIQWLDEGIQRICVTGLAGSARTLFLCRLLTEIERPCLIVLPSAKEALGMVREMTFFFPESYVSASPGARRLYDFPIYDISPLTGLSPHRDVITQRIEALYAMSAEEQPIVVTSVEAILLRVLPKEAMIRATDLLEVGEEIERESLLKRLESNGYLRTSLVEERGDYSVRGGVVDFFPPLHSSPVRLEFWGDRIESIRHFDAVSQRSMDHMKELVLLPAGEIILEKENTERARSMGRLPGPVGQIGSFPGQEAWLQHFYPRLDTIFDYFPKDKLLFLIDPLQIQKEAKKFSEKFLKDAEKFEREAQERERPFPEIGGIPLDHESLPSIVDSYQCMEWSELPLVKASEVSRTLHITGPREVTGALEIRLAGRGRVSLAPLAEKISQWLAEGARVVLICRTEQQALRLKEILQNYQVHVNQVVKVWQDVPPGKGLCICLGRLSKGFSWADLGLHVVSEDEIFGPKRPLSRPRAGVGEGGAGLTSFSLLKIGDLVVHEDHGIGRYGGLKKMEIEKKVNDFVLIEYANRDRLYIPADRISILQKYIGADEDNPKLDQLGGRSWDLVKKKAKRSIERVAKQLVEIYAIRKHRKGFAFSRPDNYYREFEATFEHEETADQSRTIAEVLSDMESEQPMDRLVCGDVGFGKTEVAVRAAFKAVADGKQVALLVPTTVLAEQHYETFRRRMDPYHIRVGVLSRFKTPAEQKQLVAQVRSGKIDILIGTHRILQRDVTFSELGLLIIDEEQRFGVKQKEGLKRYRALVDVLALTATPIPRTFHLSLLGIRDLSIIETPPEDRMAIQTHLSPYDEPTIIHAIHFELERGGQVFFVHNRVQSINRMADRLMQLAPEARYAIAHGQMREKDLEETMIRFLNKEIDVLVCTTIIESGLDIPSANTIVINRADHFGLAQIYQLRGRVGRSDEVAYAYLMLSKDAEITRDAEKRLRALMDFSHLGAGIQLAMHDLKIRGGGNILGFAQSGHISAIGYELYIKLIEQSIAELKGEEWREEINPEINIPVSAYLPENYISDIDVRLNTYRRLSSLREESELRDAIEEMNDRFGPPPQEVSNLFEVMYIRLMMKKTGIIRLDASEKGLALTFASTTELDPQTLVKTVAGDPEKYRFLSAQKLLVRYQPGLSENHLTRAREILGRFCDLRGRSSLRDG